MIGNRIRQARLMAGLSQDDVVRRLDAIGVSLTKAGLSKYERGMSSPKATLLQQLGKALNVQPDFFLREPEVHIEWLGFRRHSRLGVREQERIHALAERQVDLFVQLRGAFTSENPERFPERTPVNSPEQAEDAAGCLRGSWGLDEYPIESMTELVETRGGIVVEIAESQGSFDGLSGVANEAHPVIITHTESVDDRKRFTIAHELGHLVMDTSSRASRREEEKLANRFAAAFLIPAKMARMELGERRARVSIPELELLKIKHGVSMQAWVLRARDLEIIDEGHYSTLIRQLHRKEESVKYEGNENPTRLRQLLLRGLAEGIVTHDDAKRWYPELEQTTTMAQSHEENRTRMCARELLRLDPEERDRILAKAFEALPAEYLASLSAEDDIADDWEDVYSE